MLKHEIFILFIIALPLAHWAHAEESSSEFMKEIEETAKDYKEWQEEEMRRNPGYRHRKTGDAYLEQGQFNQAIKEYDASLSYTPDDPSTFLQKAIAQINIGQHEAAVHTLDKAMSISNRGDKWLAWPFMYQGFAYGYLGEFDQSAKAFSQSLQQQKLLKSYIGRAAAYVQLGKEEKALQDYNDALTLAPKSAELWNAKALLHMRLMAGNIDRNHFGESCDAMRKACELGDCRAITEFSECSE